MQNIYEAIRYIINNVVDDRQVLLAAFVNKQTHKVINHDNMSLF